MDFLQAFIPLFVSIDSIGLVPIFLAVTAPLTEARRRRAAFHSVFAATALTISFMFLGELLFQFLGIRDSDFRIGGGVILLVLAVTDLCMKGKPAVAEDDDDVGLFPLAMPMIAGPATLTTILVIRGKYGTPTTMLALSANLLVLLAVLLLSSRFARLLGPGVLRALSKLVMVFLAAIAVNFIRTGIAETIGK
ncbi:MarC family protein [Humisphaera borealis]|uniref:UPF0056 membrane protein n=1 Tax=Humisphaera borealis TaxID=2807512 RepID=A0A7M2X0E9_9BACT|nr:MarC family protein [Humisphaera borealis]QOV91153.1 MarC family protein [Humisphaera borealis]